LPPFFELKMKVFVLLAVGASVFVLADNQGGNAQGGSELAECGAKFAEKVQALCGTFLDKDEIIDVSF
jgi:hypothetical protein